MAKIVTRRWDILDHLETEIDMALYLEAALEDDDPRMISVALGDVARAKGMTRIAEQTGLGRESLYKALSAHGNPQLATVLKVVDALGFRLSVKTKAKPMRGPETVAPRQRNGDEDRRVNGSSPVTADSRRRRRRPTGPTTGTRQRKPG